MGNFPSVIQPSSVHAFVGTETSQRSGASSKSSHKVAWRGGRCQRSRHRITARPSELRGKATARTGKPTNFDFVPNNPNIKIELLFTETFKGEKNIFSDNCDPSKEALELDQSELSFVKVREESEASISDFSSDPKLVMLYPAEHNLVKEHTCKATMMRKVEKKACPECHDEITDNLRKVMRMEARRVADLLGDPTIPARLNHALKLADAVIENEKFTADYDSKSHNHRSETRAGGLSQQSQNNRDTRKTAPVKDSDRDREVRAEERERRWDGNEVRLRNESQKPELKTMKHNTEFACVTQSSSPSESSEELSMEGDIKKKPEIDRDRLTLAGRSSERLETDRYQEKDTILNSYLNGDTNSASVREKSAEVKMFVTEQIKARCDESDCGTSASWESEDDEGIEEEEGQAETDSDSEEAEETSENEPDDAAKDQEFNSPLSATESDRHKFLSTEVKLASKSDVNDKSREITANSLAQDGGPPPQMTLYEITVAKVSKATLQFPVVRSIQWQTPGSVSIQRDSSGTKGSASVQVKEVGRKATRESIKKRNKPSSKAPGVKYVPIQSKFVRYYVRKPKEKSQVVNSKEILGEAPKPVGESCGLFKEQPAETTPSLESSARSQVIKVPKVKAKKNVIVPSEEIKKEEASKCDGVENSRKSPVGSGKCVEVPTIVVQKKDPTVNQVQIDPAQTCKPTKPGLMDEIKNAASGKTAITNKKDSVKLDGKTILQKCNIQRRSKNKKEKKLAPTLEPNKAEKSSELDAKSCNPVEKPNKKVKINKPVQKHTAPRQVGTKLRNKNVDVKESAVTIPSRRESSEISTQNYIPVKETKSSVTYTIADRKAVQPLEKTQLKWLDDRRRRKENLKIRQRQLAAEKLATSRNKQLCIRNNVSDVEQIVRNIDYLEAVNYFQIPPFPKIPAVDIINDNKTISNLFNGNKNDVGPIRIEILEGVENRTFGFAEKPLSKLFRFTACESDRTRDGSVDAQTNRRPAVWVNNVLDGRANRRPEEFKQLSKECSRSKINCKTINKEIVRRERVEKKANEQKRQTENLVRKKTGLDISEHLFSKNNDEKSSQDFENITLLRAKMPKMATRQNISWHIAERLTIGSTTDETKEATPLMTENGQQGRVPGVNLVDADSESDAKSRVETDLDWLNSDPSHCGSQDLLVTFKREHFESSTSGSNISEIAFLTDSNKSTAGFDIRDSVSIAESSETERISVTSLNIVDNENVSIEESTEMEQLSDKECHDDFVNEEQGVTSREKPTKKEKPHFFKKILNFRRKKPRVKT